jgi:MFS transporter, FHS family, glucose/mannose:H+ symporter
LEKSYKSKESINSGSFNPGSSFIAAAIGIFIFGLGMTTLGSIAPWLRARFLLDEIQTGTLFSILPFGLLTGSLAFGPLCDRYGYKYLLFSCCLFMAAGFLGIAFSGSLVLLKISVFLFGIGGGGMNGATSAAVADMTTNRKGSNLSLLGLFFGVGALSMPSILAFLGRMFTSDEIIAAFGWISLLTGFLYLFISFPPSKQQQGLSPGKIAGLFKSKLLLLIAFFLFCQSSFEGVMNNWTTSYIISEKSIAENAALYALSLYVAGYTIMRLLLGTAFRAVPVNKLMFISILLIVAGTLILLLAGSYAVAVTGLVILGAGLSGGFPLMLGIVAGRFAELSGTAFSFVLVIALVGNMLVNYVLGVIAERSGIHHLITVAFTEAALMLLLAFIIFKKHMAEAA